MIHCQETECLRGFLKRINNFKPKQMKQEPLATQQQQNDINNSAANEIVCSKCITARKIPCSES